MTVVLNAPNQSFSNDGALVQTEIIVEARSSNNAVTNSGMMWTTVNNSAIRIAATSSNATITNEGTGVIRGGLAAVHFEGNGGTINNAGEMIGGDYGLLVVTQSAVTVNNFFGGTIKGETGLRCASPSDVNNDGIVYGITGASLFSTKLTNSGEVGGNSYGIISTGFSTIVNTGFGGIWSSGTAIEVRGEQATIINHSDCLITGQQAAITTVNGATSEDNLIALENFGRIDGKIDLDATQGNVNDAILNKGTINGDVFLGEGLDSFNGTGGTSGKVFAEGGNDILTGGSAADILDGGSGKDKLTGGGGRDILTGGADADRFYFNALKDSKPGRANRDTIRDFDRGEGDRIDLRGIDANTNKGGDQKFMFIGDDKFSSLAGELRFKGGLLQGDVNGDGKADFEIKIMVDDPIKADFIF